MNHIAETANRWKNDPHALANDFRRFVLSVEAFTDKDHSLHHEDPDARRLFSISNDEAEVELLEVRRFSKNLACYLANSKDPLIQADLLNELISGLVTAKNTRKEVKLPSIQGIRDTATNLEARAAEHVLRGETVPTSEATETNVSVEEQLLTSSGQVPDAIHAPTQTQDFVAIETEVLGLTAEVADEQVAARPDSNRSDWLIESDSTELVDKDPDDEQDFDGGGASTETIQIDRTLTDQVPEVISAYSSEPQRQHYYKRLSSDEYHERVQDREANEIQQIKLEMAKLERLTMLRASFSPTHNDIRLLTQFVDAGGQICHETVVADVNTKAACNALERLDFVQSVVGDSSVFTGFYEITHAGRAFLEAEDRKVSTAKQKGKKSKSENTEHRQCSEELFRSALRKHHGYDSSEVLSNFAPISTRGIEALMQNMLSASTAGRLFKKHFGKVQTYKQLCVSKEIGLKLVILLGDGLHAFGSIDPTKHDIEHDRDE